MSIREIFFDPPMAVARVGGATTPVPAYMWAQTDDPRVEGETTIEPTWTLVVLADGNVAPERPTSIDLREGSAIRPVSPFLELWAMTGDSDDPASWTAERLTPALLAADGRTLADLSFVVEARNRKAARRTGREELQFGTFPAVVVLADHHQPVALRGTSLPTATPPMIPSGRHIPLGSFHVLRSRPQAEVVGQPWAGEVDVEVVRVRYTPPAGLAYGPPSSAEPRPDGARPIDPSRAFLDAAAGWAGAVVDTGAAIPADTFDGAETASFRSAGVVDDTCEVSIRATLGSIGQRRSCRASIFVALPDYAPDRRPFLSAADDLNDRQADQSRRTASMSPAEIDAWVQDLFERVYETVSLMNVDHWRSLGAIQVAAGTAIANDAVPEPTRAMGGRDALRNPLFPVSGPTPNQPLPLSEHARMRHRALADMDNLRGLVAARPGRLRQLVRAAFEIGPGESSGNPPNSTMRMPPFMRASNALPMTLTAWQYDLLMRWVDRMEAPAVAGVAAADVVPRPLSAQAEAWRARVLSRLEP